ncbi:uncharacterized protein LOC105193169 isoform X3 [Solenopsis invicta]|uniref:uncharacterized protein LOC105193169 isoform X3 n=1 Tax=Solenopsis invicta TaxID=13686 RepID=UPI00193E0CD9|nr:uncharacterized protein LOC105193169 isoform X3 [Solenopsis invicta]
MATRLLHSVREARELLCAVGQQLLLPRAAERCSVVRAARGVGRCCCARRRSEPRRATELARAYPRAAVARRRGSATLRASYVSTQVERVALALASPRKPIWTTRRRLSDAKTLFRIN